ncbi:MAG TPA: carboxypeptidase regulatory-like domain-containing protein [Gemmatimonadaceae bacterium]|nr:carboxypeptidase regulatory-like domain-containing protein [Gemmatimonadaceae bacterium]
MRWLLAAAIVLHGSIAAAQETTTLTGRILRAGSGAGLPNAEITVTPPNVRAVTDADGEFRIEGLKTGRVVIQVRRLGFAPESVTVELPLAGAIEIDLRETGQPLDTVSVKGEAAAASTGGKLAGFYERKREGHGRFLEAKDIEKMLTRRLGDIIVARIPGTQTVRGLKGGMAAYIASTRMGSEQVSSALKGALRPPRCYPDVYLDGVVVYASGSERNLPAGTPDDVVLFDVNSLDPAELAALEFYGGPAQTPAQYNKTGSACGVLLIWTK